MKLHLPSLLRSALLASFAVVAQLAEGGSMHADASQITYTDFGQNMGRYVVGNTNALLNYIRDKEGGVNITYTGGQASYKLEHGMIDFGSQADNGASAGIGYNFIATVEHNGVQAPTFTGRYLGGENAVRYQGIEYLKSENSTFIMDDSGQDYKITRLNKLVTDVDMSTVYGSANGDYSDIMDRKLTGELMYHSGSGSMYKVDHDGNSTRLAGAYGYMIGTIMSIDALWINNATTESFRTQCNEGWSADMISPSDPLPYAAQAGDSGSPNWVWNASTQQYEYFGACQGRGAAWSFTHGASQWSHNKMVGYDNIVDVAANATIYVNATLETDTTLTDGVNNVTTTLWKGSVTDEQGNILTDFVGVENGKNTWNDLSSLKDRDNWYNYGNSEVVKDGEEDKTVYFFNATPNGAGTDLTYADLYYTENLNFHATSEGSRNVVLNANVDLGLGYAQFSKLDSVENAVDFTLSSAEGYNYQLNSSGYVVGQGVNLHIKLTNSTADIMREWRKVGEGNLYLEGTGDNNILLNVGGSGTTYLNQTGGYAAYNVLANNGTTVVINDINQIERDFTFGNRGGVLDMNGKSMSWNNDNVASADGFTIHALDEDAIITNTAAQTTTTLTWTQGGEQKWLGSFRDTEQGALKFIYAGGEGASLRMHGIFTDLSNNENSGIEVQSGALSLSGTNTVHGLGSETGRTVNRHFDVDDWHYADAKTDVVVAGGVFELGSHARLTGDVSVKAGGIYVMHEGVKHQYEYIEGGQIKEDTYEIAAFYGHKGDVSLAEGASMQVKYSDGTTANTTYAGAISGSGSLSVEAGTTGGSITLAGDNSGFSGTKLIASGGVIATTNNGLGDVSAHKWVVNEAGWLASHEFTNEMTPEQILGYVDTSSTGVLALSNDLTQQFDLEATGHTGLIIGAEAGRTVEYGVTNTDVALKAIDGKWTLGGGGGELVVNFVLEGENTLVLGNHHGKGEVTLTNANNSFTGGIVFAGGVTLDYTVDGALGGDTFNLTYSNRLFAHSNNLDSIDGASGGVLLVDFVQSSDLDLSGKRDLFIGADGEVSYTGSITLAEGADYNFGGVTGKLGLATVLQTGHNMVLDGQTYSGGRVVLENAQTDFKGTVTVMGYDTAKTDNEWGDITLSFSADNMLTGAAAVTLKDGGIMDLAGTVQTLNNVSTVAGALLTDSSEELTGTLILNYTENLSLDGDSHVRHLEKTGDGTLTMNGFFTHETFKINGGSVVLGVDNVMSGTTYIGAGATLDVNGKIANGPVVLNGGTLLNSDSSGKLSGAVVINDGTIENAGVISNELTMNGGTLNTTGTVSGAVTMGGGTISGANTISGAIAVTGGNNVINSTGTLTIAGVVTKEAGDLTLSGQTIKLNNAQFGSAGQTVKITASELDINDPIAAKTFNGTLAFDGSDLANKTITIDDGYFSFNNAQSDDGHRNIARTFDHIDIVADTTLRINSQSKKFGAYQTGQFWNLVTVYERYHSTMVYNVHELSGDGDLWWESNDSCQSFGASRLILDGEGTLSGTITLNRVMSQHTNFAYSSSIVLAHDLAAQHAGIDLTGKNANAQAMLAIGTDNAHIAGLNGNTYSHLYAGAGISTAQQAAPVNSRYATLTIQGDGNYVYNGTIGGNATTTNGLHLVMAGSGTQTFSGNALAFEGVTVQAGTLKLNAAGLNLTNAVTIYDNATLQLGADANFSSSGTLTLKEGNVLNILVDNAGAAATLDGNLALNGGQMHFDASYLSVNSPLLNLTGTVTAGDAFTSLIIDFTDTQLVEVGQTYKLANQNWSGITVNDITMDYMTATFTAGAEGLFVHFGAKEQFRIWNGTDAAHSWDAMVFGADTQSFTGTQKAVFTDAATNREVNVTGNVSVAGLLFDTENEYTVTTADGVTLTASRLELESSGAVMLDSGVNITGATTIAAGGKLTVKEFSTLGGSVSGEGTLAIDAGNEAGSVGGINNLNTLQLLSGRYQTSGAVGASNIDVIGGQFHIMGGEHSNALTLSGAGWSGDDAGAFGAGAALLIESGATVSGDIDMAAGSKMAVNGSTVSGAVRMGEGASVKTAGATILPGALSLDGNVGMEVTNGTTTVSGVLNGGSHTLTKTGAGALTLKTATTSGSVDVQGGSLRIADIACTGLESITLGSGTNLVMEAKASLLDTAIHMKDNSTINLMNGRSDWLHELRGNIDIDGTATIAGSIYGNASLVSGSVTGNGVLQLKSNAQSGTGVSGTNAWAISSVISDGEGGKLAVVSSHNVTIRGNNSYTGGTTVTGGTLTTGNVNALAAGSLNITGGGVALGSQLLLSSLEGSSGAVVNLNAQTLTIAADSTEGKTYSGNVTGTGTLVKTGAGVQNFNGNVTLGNLDVQAGTLNLTGQTSSIAGTASVAQGATLTLGGTFSLEETIINSGTISLANGLSFALDHNAAMYDESTRTFMLISGNGHIDYAGKDIEFTYDGISLNEFELGEDRFSAHRSENSLSVTVDLTNMNRNVAWSASGDSGVWNTSKDVVNWTLTESAVGTNFHSLDRVVFGAEGAKNVSVEGKVIVDSMSVENAAYVFSGGEVKSTDSMTIAANASVTFDDVTVTGMLTADGNLTVNGNGVFESASIINSLAVGDGGSVSAKLISNGFSGAVTVGENASLTLNGGSQVFNAKVVLEEGSTFEVFTSGGRSQFNNELVLNGNTTVNYGSGKDLLVANKFTGNGHTVTKTGEGLLWLAPTAMSNVSFIVEEGKLRIGGTAGKGIPEGVSAVALKSGTELSFCAGDSSFATNLSLEGGSSIDLSSTNGKGVSYTFDGSVELKKASDNSIRTTINNGANRTLTITGAITGDGGLELDNHAALTLNLNNTKNSFTGGIVAHEAVTLNLASAGSAGTGQIELNHYDAALTVVGNTAGAYDVMNNVITGAGSVTVTSGNLTFNDAQGYEGATIVKNGANLKLSGSGAIHAGDAVSVSSVSNGPSWAAYLSPDDESALVDGTLSNVTVGAASMHATEAGFAGTVSNALVTVNAKSYAIENVSLMGTQIQSSAEGGALTMTNVTMDANSMLVGYDYTSVTAQDVSINVGANLTYQMVSGYDYGLNFGDIRLFTLDNFNNLALTGEITLDVSSLIESNGLIFDSAYAFSFGDSVDVTGANVVTRFGNEMNMMTNVEGSIAFFNVPEPGTASLSLIGLAALLMRRRRVNK